MQVGDPALHERCAGVDISKRGATRRWCRLEAIGTVLNPRRTLIVRQFEVYGVRAVGSRKLVANGQQALIQANRPAE
ncbi:hypothetical protein [Streptomyces sp. NPDC002521]